MNDWAPVPEPLSRPHCSCGERRAGPLADDAQAGYTDRSSFGGGL